MSKKIEKQKSGGKKEYPIIKRNGSIEFTHVFEKSRLPVLGMCALWVDDGKTMIIGGSGGKISRVNYKTMRVEVERIGHANNRVWGICKLNDHSVVTSGDGTEVIVWEIDTLRVKKRFDISAEANKNWIPCVMRLDDRTFCGGEENGKTLIFKYNDSTDDDGQTNAIYDKVEFNEQRIISIARSKIHESLILTVGGRYYNSKMGNRISLWDWKVQKLIRKFDHTGREHDVLALETFIWSDRRSERVVQGDGNGKIDVFSWEGKVLFTFEKGSKGIIRASLLFSDRYLIVGSVYDLHENSVAINNDDSQPYGVSFLSWREVTGSSENSNRLKREREFIGITWGRNLLMGKMKNFQCVSLQSEKDFDERVDFLVESEEFCDNISLQLTEKELNIIRILLL